MKGPCIAEILSLHSISNVDDKWVTRSRDSNLFYSGMKFSFKGKWNACNSYERKMKSAMSWSCELDWRADNVSIQEEYGQF